MSAILCLGLNPALDVTYRVPSVVHGEAQRVREVLSCAGGKASNVAHVAHLLGAEAHLLLPAGGSTGVDVLILLDAMGMPHTHVPISGATRRTVAVVEDDGAATVFNEPGPPTSDRDWTDIIAATTMALDEGVGCRSGVRQQVGVLVLSGSVPPGSPPDAIGELVRLGRARGIPVIADVSGDHLLRALEAGASIVKPNAHELSEVVGARGVEGARRLAARASGTVVVASAGPEGMVAVGPGVHVSARPAAELSGNPTGAGDAAVAALAMGVVAGQSWPERLRNAVASSAAAVLETVGGLVDPRTVTHLRETVIVTESQE